MKQDGCIVHGCRADHYGLGYCRRHYCRVKAHGDATVTFHQREHSGLCDVAGCERPYFARGKCQRHYHRLRKYGDCLAGGTPIDKPLALRIAERSVLRENGCVEWVGSTDGHGYGQINYRRRVLKAYRVSFELARGPVPAGLELDHLCRNPLCINPDHLEPVTHAENMRRMRATKEEAA